MILLTLLDIIFSLFEGIFSLLPFDIPNFPDSLLNTINSFLNLIFNNLSLLGFFVPINLIKILLPLVIIVLNFNHIYNIAQWIIRKIRGS